MGKRIKLLVISDAPSSSTGLGRITRELCERIYADCPEFELATLGSGGNVSSRFPWRQYVIGSMPNFTIPDLPRVWQDFAGDDKGILFAIWNPSWLWWLADPLKLGSCTLKDFLLSNPFEKWIYAPIDAEGPNGLLPLGIADILARFDRALYYTKWSADMAFRTDVKAYGDFLPHGTDTGIFYPRSKEKARETFIERVTDAAPQPLVPGMKLIGVTATNTPRKDWAFAFEVCGELVKRGVNIGLWAHTDRFKGHWDILGMMDTFGLRGRIIPTNKMLSDEDLAWAYSACDVTLGIGRGEGWGLPISESLACGVPCLHCDYAGAAEFLPEAYKIAPDGFYYDDGYLNLRPVMSANRWADQVERILENSTKYEASLGEKFTWDGCWKKWKEWLTRGI